MIASERAVRLQPASRAPRLIAWGVLSLAPLAAYAVPLWQNVLADTPIAYLVWIPILSVLWGAYGISQSRPAVDDGELDAILGIGLLALVGAALVIGPARWPYLFLMQSSGLLLWPLWMLGMAWLLFGVGVTQPLLWPLAYLLLCWPPVLSAVASLTQGVLVRIAIAGISRGSHYLSWLQAQGHTGTFLVAHGGTLVPVLISEACSGADSALGAAILLPVLLTQSRGAAWRKMLLVVAALVGAVVFNLLRLVAIIVALHYDGEQFALGVLHPVLGFFLFALLAFCLVAVAGLAGLSLRPAAKALPPLGGPSRVLTSWVLGAGLFALLWPLFSTPYGAPGKPLAVRSSSISALLPNLRGFTVASTHRFNDASILGPGAVSVAKTYVAKSGAAVLVEVWSTPNLGNLESYGFRNCLLFHGERLNALQVFDVASQTAAADYALQLPPAVVGGGWTRYEDIEWESAVRLPGGGVRYLRYAVAALPQPPSDWPRALRSAPTPEAATGISALAMPPSFGSWPSDLRPTRSSLERFATVLAQSVAKMDSRSEAVAIAAGR